MGRGVHSVRAVASNIKPSDAELDIEFRRRPPLLVEAVLGDSLMLLSWKERTAVRPLNQLDSHIICEGEQIGISRRVHEPTRRLGEHLGNLQRIPAERIVVKDVAWIK